MLLRAVKALKGPTSSFCVECSISETRCRGLSGLFNQSKRRVYLLADYLRIFPRSVLAITTRWI